MSVWQKMFSTAISNSNTKNHSVLDLCIGDTVTHDLMDYLVVGQINYYDEDSGLTWIDYELEGDGYTWLVFEKDLDLVAIYKPADLDLSGKPPQEIKYQGLVYSLCESGRAEISMVNGEPADDKRGLIKYWQYQDRTGGYMLCLEDSGGKLKMSCGYCIRPDEIRLMRKLRAIY